MSAVGRKAADLVADPFTVSHGRSQPVAVTAKRALTDLRLSYRVNGGSTGIVRTTEWKGGERYGATHDAYYAEFRGTVPRQRPGDSVEVWFTGHKPGTGQVSSDHFTYKVATDVGGDVLVLAAEDVTGISPVQQGTSAKYASRYAAALTAAGYTSDVYDVDVNDRTAPHHLGVLSHYDAVVWETVTTSSPSRPGSPPGPSPSWRWTSSSLSATTSTRAASCSTPGSTPGSPPGANGDYFYNPFEEEQGECQAPQYPCLPLLNDFQQYWLGAYDYLGDSGTGPDGPFAVSGKGGAFDGFGGSFNGGDSAGNQDPHRGLPAHLELPATRAVPAVRRSGTAALAAADRSAVRAGHRRLVRLLAACGLDVQEADPHRGPDLGHRRAGPAIGVQGLDRDRARLGLPDGGGPDRGRRRLHDAAGLPGHTSSDIGDSCGAGWVAVHPHLAHYQGPGCEPAGTTGAWHAASGTSGWTDWNVDLSGYAGKKVELSISYVSDSATQGLGVFVDDASVLVGGVPVTQTSFEADLGGWTVSGAPTGSVANSNDWRRSQVAFVEGAGVTTKDTVFVGFGAEGLTTQAMRTDLVRRSMDHLLGPAR